MNASFDQCPNDGGSSLTFVTVSNIANSEFRIQAFSSQCLCLCTYVRARLSVVKNVKVSN